MGLHPILVSITIIKVLKSKTLGFACTHYYVMFRNPLVGMGVERRVTVDPPEHRETTAINQDLFHFVIPYD